MNSTMHIIYLDVNTRVQRVYFTLRETYVKFMANEVISPIPIDAIPISRTQRQEQILGDREIALEIGWTNADDIGRVIVSISKRDDENAQKLRELFCLTKDREHWLFQDLTSGGNPTRAEQKKVKSYLLEKYNLDIEWDGKFWEGELPY